MNEYWTKAVLTLCGAAAVAVLVANSLRATEAPLDTLTYYAGDDPHGAKDCVQKLGIRSAPLLLQEVRKERHLRCDIVTALASLGPPAAPALIHAFGDSSPLVRLAAVRAFLSLRGDLEPQAPAASRPLLVLTRDPNVEIRYAAALAWRRMGATRVQAIPALISALAPDELGFDDESACIRMVAAQTLGRIGPEAAAAATALLSTLHEPPSELRKEALVALWRITQDTGWIEAELGRMLADPDCRARSAAVVAVHRISREAPLSACVISEAEINRDVDPVCESQGSRPDTF